jgi:ATP synthase protein I
MLKAVFLQACITLATAFLAAVFLGWQGFISAGLGGVAVLLPNALFALKLHFQAKRAGSFPMAFLVGEVFKIAATVGLMVLVWYSVENVHWLAFFVGLVLALKANLFALLLKT